MACGMRGRDGPPDEGELILSTHVMPDGRSSGAWTGDDIERYAQRWDNAIKAAADRAAAARGCSVAELTEVVFVQWLFNRGYLKAPRVKKRAAPS